MILLGDFDWHTCELQLRLYEGPNKCKDKWKERIYPSILQCG